MTATRASRQAATAVALAVALGTAGAATARSRSTCTAVANCWRPYVSPPSQPATPHATAGGSEWAYLAIGGGAVGLAVVGGTLAAGQRRNRKTRPGADESRGMSGLRATPSPEMPRHQLSRVQRQPMNQLVADLSSRWCLRSLCGGRIIGSGMGAVVIGTLALWRPRAAGGACAMAERLATRWRAPTCVAGFAVVARERTGRDRAARRPAVHRAVFGGQVSSLYVAVSRSRRLLEGGEGGEVLVTRPGGYMSS